MNIIILSIIILIESSGNPLAFNKHSQARGLCQITPVVLQEYNNRHKTEYLPRHLFLPEINKKIARWYLNKRIPQMLKHFKKEVNERNILISYNAGINYVVKDLPLPPQTKEYLIKYKQKKGGENE